MYRRSCWKALRFPVLLLENMAVSVDQAFPHYLWHTHILGSLGLVGSRDSCCQKRANVRWRVLCCQFRISHQNHASHNYDTKPAIWVHCFAAGACHNANNQRHATNLLNPEPWADPKSRSILGFYNLHLTQSPGRIP